MSKLTEIKERVESFNADPNLYGVVMTVDEMNHLISLLEEKDENIKKNDEEIENMLHAFQMLQMENSKLENNLEEKDKALAFYADDKNYEQEKVPYDEDIPNDCYYECPEVLQDKGERAKKALNTSSNSEGE